MKPKYLLGGSLIVAAAAVLIVTGMMVNAQYFLTITQLRDKGPGMVDRSVRVSGAVIYESALYEVRDSEPYLEFDVVDAEDQIGRQTPLRIVYTGPKPDLLQPHTTAVIEGRLGADGKFYADTLLLKCPTRYEEQFPNQVEKSGSQIVK
jgi:cytochrome c-type biogenesis protein CcmE